MKEAGQQPGNQERAPGPWPIILGILGAVAIIVAAVIQGLAAIEAPRVPIHATQTEVAHETIVALSATPSAALTQQPSALPSSTFTPPPPATSTPALTPLPSPTPPCAFRGSTDDETIMNLIQEEAVASNTKSMSIMQDIFAADALIRDYAPPTGPAPQIWKGPVARYQDDLFKRTTLNDVAHFGIQAVGLGISEDTATYVSGSRGCYMSGAQCVTFNNLSRPGTPYGSDHWILQKDTAGCWVITGFDFNAGHVPFP